MSILKMISAQLGISTTPANNFTITAIDDNGTMKLARGNPGTTTQDILTVDALGKIDFPQLLKSIASNGFITIAGELIIQWGYVAGAASDQTITFPTPFKTSCYGVFGTAVGALTAAQTIGFSYSSPTLTNFVGQLRYINNGGVAGMATQPYTWFAIGK